MSGSPQSVSAKSLFTNWAVLIALWAPVYVSLLEHFRLDAAHSDALKWALVAIGACGMAAMLATCWQASHSRKRRSHGLRARAPDGPASNAPP